MGVWPASRPARLYLRKDPVPIVQESGWVPEPVWIGVENLAPQGFDPRNFQPVASRIPTTPSRLPGTSEELEKYAVRK